GAPSASSTRWASARAVGSPQWVQAGAAVAGPGAVASNPMSAVRVFIAAARPARSRRQRRRQAYRALSAGQAALQPPRAVAGGQLHHPVVVVVDFAAGAPAGGVGRQLDVHVLGLAAGML